MPFLSAEELKERLESPDNLKNKISTLIIHERAGRSIEVPMEIKKVACLLASNPERDETHQEIADSLDLGRREVSRYGEGKTHNAPQHPELKRLLDENREQRDEAETKAISTLLTVLDIIPSRVTSGTPLKTLSTLAKDMSIVADKVSGRSRESIQDNSQQVHLHIYAPRQKKVEDYDTIDI